MTRFVKCLFVKLNKNQEKQIAFSLFSIHKIIIYVDLIIIIIFGDDEIQFL